MLSLSIVMNREFDFSKDLYEPSRSDISKGRGWPPSLLLPPALEKSEKWLWPPLLLYKGEVTRPSSREKGEMVTAALSLLDGGDAIPSI